MPRDDLYLREALNAAERIIALAVGQTAATLTTDATTRDALLWNFTVLGEAVGQFTGKDRYPHIEWRKPVALRNRIVHGYWSADLDILIDAAQRSVPGLRDDLVQIIGTLSDADPN